MSLTFEKLDLSFGERSTVFLDVDGTIVADSNAEISPKVVRAVQELARGNVVYLLSNTDDAERNRTLTRRLGLRYLDTPHKKPRRRILDAVPGDHRQYPLVVIGDKAIVDGLFALRIGARFVKVERMISPRDRAVAKLAYALDDAIVWLLSLCKVRVSSVN